MFTNPIKRVIMKYAFSGHESFQCKGLWLKKGYDYVKAGLSFTDDYAVVELGVGKNMVASIRYWLRAFGITNDNGVPTEIGKYLLDDNGADPYIEDTTTLWLLHYMLVTSRVATLYNIVFTEYNKTRKEFTKADLANAVRRMFADKCFDSTPYNEKTIWRDIDTMLKNYVTPDSIKACDDFSALLIDLKLIGKAGHEDYTFNCSARAKMEPLVFLFAVLDITQGKQQVIEFEVLLRLANIFGMSVNELYDVFDQLHTIDPHITFCNTAGEQLFTMKERIDKWQVLNKYYQAT